MAKEPNKNKDQHSRLKELFPDAPSLFSLNVPLMAKAQFAEKEDRDPMDDITNVMISGLPKQFDLAHMQGCMEEALEQSAPYSGMCVSFGLSGESKSLSITFENAVTMEAITDIISQALKQTCDVAGLTSLPELSLSLQIANGVERLNLRGFDCNDIA